MSHQAAEVESWRWRVGKPGGAAVAAKVGVALARVEPALCELEHFKADGPDGGGTGRRQGGKGGKGGKGGNTARAEKAARQQTWWERRSRHGN